MSKWPAPKDLVHQDDQDQDYDQDGFNDQYQHGAPRAKKRKRVTRACDECRKKKVKCDGQMPCIHCTVYSYECTYDQPSTRRKIPDSVRLESRLKTAEILIDALLPGVDIYSPSFDLAGLLDAIKKSNKDSNSQSPLSTATPNPALIANNFRLLNGSRFTRPGSGITMSSPDMSSSSPQSLDGTEFKIILPPKHVASQLIENVWDNACVLFRLYHRPSFIRDLDLLYETDPEDYSQKQYKILPMVYSVMAVGVLFSKNASKELGIKDAEEGYKYFAAARKLIDITDAKDLYSIQSIVMMIIFLQCSARLSTCYSYIGLALRAALRAGLHRKVQYNFNPIELETRKRLFWTIRKMDIYVNAMLGLPRTTSEDDFDQELPAEIDDENITEDGYYPQQEGKLSSVGISNAHTRLMTVLNHIIEALYPVQKRKNDSVSSFSKVESLEQEIKDWHSSLPEYLVPGAQVPMEYFKANRLLSLAYCYIQIMLYRPFIHLTPNSDPRAQLYSRKCIDVARRSVYFANDLVSQNMLSGAYWYSVYTLFFSVACLVYYVHENAYTAPEYAQQLRLDAEVGRAALNRLRDGSMAASRTYNLLNSLFDKLNQRVGKEGSENREIVGDISLISDNSSGSGGGSLLGDSMTLPSQQSTLPSQSQEVKQDQQGQNQQQQQQQQQQPLFMDQVVVPPLQQQQLPTQGVDTQYDPMVQFEYAPGPMDQVDQQLFGRFLPPYMTSQYFDSGTSGENTNSSATPAPGAETGTIDTNSNDTNTNAFSTDELLNDKTSLFGSKEWDDFLSQNVELSGVNSLNPMDNV